MSSLVLELQQDILNPDCDVLNALRKAHLIASKLKLTEFDEWLQHELNGYLDIDNIAIPEYREVKGSLKAYNPYRGWIPAQFINDEIEKTVCVQKMWQSLGELQELYNQCTTSTFTVQFSAEAMATVASLFNTPIPMNYALHVSVHYLKTIAESVKNCLLEWTIKLEDKGILGEDMRFSQEETTMAKTVPQQINNYYGTVVNGDVKQSQVVSGDHNTISFNYEQANDLIQKIKEAVAKENLSVEDRETANELIAETETKIVAQKKPGIIKAAWTGLKDFLIGAGANVAGALIVQYLQQGI